MPEVSPIPAHYPQISPYLVVRDGAGAIEFYKTALGATERFRLACPKTGKVLHAELQIGQGLFMLSEEWPECNILGPSANGSTGVTINLYVEDVDATVEQARKAGAKIATEPKNEFYGDRSARVIDPYGHAWNISTHVEDVSPEEMDRRFKASFEES